jgi:DNA-binding GntR family transcriptional regulator
MKAIHVDILDRATANITSALLDEAQDVDTGFHNHLIAATGNELLIQAYGVNAIRVRLIKLDRIRLTPLVLNEAFKDHLEVIDAIGARDRGRATAAIERHMRNARDRAVAL